MNGAVIGLFGVPAMERANTEAGVFISKVGLGLIRSSVPEVTFIISRTEMMKGIKQSPKIIYVYRIRPDVSEDVFLSLPVDRDLALPLVATVS